MDVKRFLVQLRDRQTFVVPPQGKQLLRLSVLAFVVVLLLPGFCEAAVLLIGFRNDTKGPIIVQGMGIVGGQLHQGRRLTIQPGGIAWDVVVAPGNKVITVRDGQQPTRVLARETIQCGLKNLFFAIEVDADPAANPKKGKAKPTPKVKLTPALPPAAPMGTTGLPIRR
jgi:hypothetical protein